MILSVHILFILKNLNLNFSLNVSTSNFGQIAQPIPNL